MSAISRVTITQPLPGTISDEQPSSTTTVEDDEESIFSKPWQSSDGVLVVERKELHVHSNILSISSQYFEKIFNGNFKESCTKRVTLEGKKYKLIENMFRIIYPIKSRIGNYSNTFSSTVWC